MNDTQEEIILDVEDSSHVSRIRASVDELLSYDLTRLFRDELGPLSFRPIASLLRSYILLFRRLRNASIIGIPEPRLAALAGWLDEIKAEFGEIVSSDWDGSSRSHDKREAVMHRLQAQYPLRFDLALPVLAYSYASIRSEHLEALVREITSKKEQFDRLLSEAKQAERQTQEEAQNALRALRQAAEEAGLTRHSVHFKQCADAHAKLALCWLAATVVTAVCTIYAAFQSFTYYLVTLKDMTVSQSIHFAVTKLVVFSVFLTAVVWTGRVYKAQRHNSVVNRHRQNALSTFEAFANATTDPAVKNAILLQATQSIFLPQPSGYIIGDSDSGAHSPILEIIRSVADGVSSKAKS